MNKLVRQAGDRLLSAVLPKAVAKACGWTYLGTCYTGSGSYRPSCDQEWNSCNGADRYKIYDP